MYVYYVFLIYILTVALTLASDVRIADARLMHCVNSSTLSAGTCSWRIDQVHGITLFLRWTANKIQ